MKQTEARIAFPIASTVQRKDGRPLIWQQHVGVVTGHPQYLMAMIGKVTHIEVTNPATGVVLGEFQPNDLVIRRLR
jgi:hypothetical protein